MSTKDCAATTSNGAGARMAIRGQYLVDAFTHCLYVLPENPWVKEKMLAKTWGVRPGLRSDNGAARRGGQGWPAFGLPNLYRRCQATP